MDTKNILRIEKKLKEIEPKAESQFMDALAEIKNLGYKPKLAIILPNYIIPEGINNIFGIPIEHRVIRTPDGKMIPILFECEEHGYWNTNNNNTNTHNNIRNSNTMDNNQTNRKNRRTNKKTIANYIKTFF